MTRNEKAFLDMIAFSEGTAGKGDDGYNVIVGGALWDGGYDSHPNVLVHLQRLGVNSTAAGRYQLLYRYYVVYKKQLGLKDFSPASQDRIALQQISECDAIDDIDNGEFETAVVKCAHIWASLPGAGYNQHENKMTDLRAAYIRAGGEAVP